MWRILKKVKHFKINPVAGKLFLTLLEQNRELFNYVS